MKVNLKERFGIFAKKKKNLPPVGLEPTTFDVIYQTRETGFHRDIQRPRREWKIRRAAEYF